MRPPSRGYLKTILIINSFKDKWGWTPVDVAEGVRHVMPGAKLDNRRSPVAEDVAGREIPEDLLEMMRAMDADEEVAGAAAVEPAVDQVDLDGFGKVDKSLYDALVNPARQGAAPTRPAKQRQYIRGHFLDRTRARLAKRPRLQREAKEAADEAVEPADAAMDVVDGVVPEGVVGEAVEAADWSDLQDGAAAPCGDETPGADRYPNPATPPRTPTLHGAAKLAEDEPASLPAVAEQATPASIETPSVTGVGLPPLDAAPVVEQTSLLAPSEGANVGNAGQQPLHPPPVAEQAIVAAQLVPPPPERVVPARSHISGIEFAASGRSKCRACSETIANKCVRFSVFLPKMSRLGYVHLDCIAQFAEVPPELAKEDISFLQTEDEQLRDSALAALLRLDEAIAA